MSKIPDHIQRMIKEQERLQKMFDPPDCIQKIMEEHETFLKHLEPPDYVQKMVAEQEALLKKIELPDFVQEMVAQQESLLKRIEPPDYVQEIIAQQEALLKMIEPTDYVQEMIAEQEALLKRIEPPDYMLEMFKEQETFRQMFSTEGVVASSFKSLIDHGAFESIDFIERIKSFSSDLSISDLKFNGDGSLSVDDQYRIVSDLSVEVSSFFQEISKNSSIENVLSCLKCLKQPARRIAVWILNNIVVAFFVSVMAGLYTPALQTYFETNPPKRKREVNQTVKMLPSEINIEEYKGYRVVTAEVLNLRLKPNTKSRVIAKLYRGKLVHIIQKNKNWAKVEVLITEISDEKIIGWVSTRYIVALTR